MFFDDKGKFIEPTPRTLEKASPAQLTAINSMRDAMKELDGALADDSEIDTRLSTCAKNLNRARQWEHVHPSGQSAVDAARQWINSTR